MLLDPEDDEQLRYPDPEGSQAVEAGVAAGADGNQPVAVVDARLTVMHMEAVGGAAGPALAAVPVQNLLAESGEALAGIGRGAVAGAAEAGDPGKVPAAGAEEGALESSGQETIVQQNSLR